MKYQPPLPPRIAAQLPDDPFEQWLMRQAVGGYDRHWLNRNAPALRVAWARGQTSDLPPAPTPSAAPVPDRYDEI